MAVLKKPYEISVWEDILVTTVVDEQEVSYYDEKKILVIGSNEMTGPNKVYEPILKENMNGEVTLTFSLKYKYFDPISEKMVINPFESYLVNERKIKLYYDNKWYDFIIKSHEESSDEYIWTYTAVDAAVLELSKTGYNIEFDAELNNNQGTAIELAEKTLEGTDWVVDKTGSTIGQQKVEEAIYKAVIGTDITVLDTDTNNSREFHQNDEIYVFYSYVANKSGRYVQFIERDVSHLDDKNNIIATNYRILDELIYDDVAYNFKLNDEIIISVEDLETKHHAYRLVYGQLTTYDPVMQRTVDVYTVSDVDTAYKYTDYSYTTSDIVIPYITNGNNFDVNSGGDLQGWSEMTSTYAPCDPEKEPFDPEETYYIWNNVTEKYEVVEEPREEDYLNYYIAGHELNSINLTTYPEINIDTSLADLVKYVSDIEGFLEVKFVDIFKDYKNSIFNSGIEDNISLLNSISQGQEFVLRWRAAMSSERHGEVLEDFTGLGAIVAKYTKEVEGDYYVNTIDPQNIILEFNTEPIVLNNIITGGYLDQDNTIYIINGVPQTPSTKYIYMADNESYVWDKVNHIFIPKDNSFIDYHYIKATAQKSISNTELINPETNIGIFIYLKNGSDADKWYYIQDIQLTKYFEDANGDPVVIGNVPTAQSITTEHYYVKPVEGSAAEDIETYTTIDALADGIGVPVSAIKPVYNEDSVKILSISESHSNCFNILQSIAETFEVWLSVDIQHDEDGKIHLENYKPIKTVAFKEFAGKDNYAGFKYGINLNSISRNIESDEIVTKLIVDQAQSDYTDEGYVSIRLADSNPSGESFILNFDYYLNKKLIEDEEACREDVELFNESVKQLNNELNELEATKLQLDNSLLQITSKRNVYTELVDTAKDLLNEGLIDFKKITGWDYSDYIQIYNGEGGSSSYYFLSADIKVNTNKTYYTYDSGTDVYTEVLNPPFDGNPKELGYYEKVSTIGSIFVLTQDRTIDPEKIYYQLIHRAFIPVETPVIEDITTYYEKVADFLDNETIIDIIGQIYANSSVINNYEGLLTNVEIEYKDIRKKLYGNEAYTFTVSVISGDNKSTLKIYLSDYVIPFEFTVNGNSYSTDVSTKSFNIDIDSEQGDYSIKNLNVGDSYIIYDISGEPITEIDYQPNKIQKFTIKPNVEVNGIVDDIKIIQELKNTSINNFFNKYSRFIQEGTWSSTEYIDSNLYYLDALQVSNTSAEPKVSYTINVVEVSELEGLENYKFAVGDKTWVEDEEFFGWNAQLNMPAREEVIVSEVEWHLDEPENNVITVQNYKTQFEDLFQRVSATVQSVQYNEATYAKTSSFVDANGTIKQDTLLASLDNIKGRKYALTTDGSVYIDGENIHVQNLTNPANRVIINSEGIRVSDDGGANWSTAVSGRGIDAGLIYTGSLNTDEVIIGNRDNPSFRWDKYGISAFKKYEDEKYDLRTYVRFDQYGLYGIQNDEAFKAQTITEVEEKANFGITWHGFFIKNSYTNGRVEITSDNDFRVVQTVGNQDKERIKIGAIGKNINNEPIYGIRISKLDNGVVTPVFVTDERGDITITGTINATGGNFSEIVTVGKQEGLNPPPWIEIDGRYEVTETVKNIPTIRSSNYQDGAGPGWLINSDGDAYFNNITARGAIKTAVFEYAEIQAVGGVFLFRPSSAIKSAEIVEGTDNVKVTVDNHLLFKDGQWCKVSNYYDGNNGPDIVDPNTQEILQNNGLSYVYPITKNNNNIILVGAREMLDDEVISDITDLIGGSLVDMGNINQTSNYGIGINSSDNTINLPARAISLFETQINSEPSATTKVAYNYRGILGTLPKMNSGVALDVYQYMQNTQGIYTDNMYIGDDSSYLAFYTNRGVLPPRKTLTIHGADIWMTYGGTEQTIEQVIDEIEAGEGLVIVVTSSEGTIFNSSIIQTTLTATVYQNGEEVLDITPYGTLNWYIESSNAVYIKTLDTIVDLTKTYYIYDAITQTYEIVIDPVTADITHYYENENQTIGETCTIGVTDVANIIVELEDLGD